MPRCALSDREVAALLDHLAALPRLQRVGVSEAAVAFGIPAVTDREGALYLDQLKKTTTERLGGAGVHGRQVEFVFLAPTTRPEAAGIFAALALPRAWLPAYREAGVPVLFPFSGLDGGEDPGLLRDFLPSKEDLRRALAQRLAAEADGPVAVVPPGAEAEALVRSLRPAGGEADGGPGAGPAAAREVVVLDAAALPRAFSEASGARLWLDRNLLVQGGRLPPGREAVVYTGDPCPDRWRHPRRSPSGDGARLDAGGIPARLRRGASVRFRPRLQRQCADRGRADPVRRAGVASLTFRNGTGEMKNLRDIRRLLVIGATAVIRWRQAGVRPRDPGPSVV